jgi:hypothetical protein
METIGKVKLKIAVGIKGIGGCIIEAIELPDEQSKVDVEEYGAWLDDFFHNGSKPPKEAGVYIFEGEAAGYPGSDETYRYSGNFKRIDTNP